MPEDFYKQAEQIKKSIETLRADVRRGIETLESDIKHLDRALRNFEKVYNKEVTPNINAWNKAVSDIGWGTKLILGFVIAALMALIGLG